MVADYSAQLMSNYKGWRQFSDTLEDSAMGGNYTYDPMSMNGTIFSNGFSGGVYGGSNYYSSPEYLNMTPEQRVQANAKLTIATITSQNDVAKLNRGLQRQNQASEDSVTKAVAILHDLAVNDRQDQVPGAYANLLEAVRAQYKEDGIEATEEHVKATADNAYFEATHQRISDDLNQHGLPQFIHGLIQGTGIGAFFVDGKTAKDNAAAINGQPVSNGDVFANVAGIAIGAVATGLAAFALIRHGGNPIHGITSSFKNMNVKGAEKLISELNPESARYKQLKPILDAKKAVVEESQSAYREKRANKFLNRL